jgi:xanthine dehydrogenase iron-sulfur cluster and FAD-binding subunit A
MGAVRCLLNDRAVLVEAPPGLAVLAWLRERRELTGTREGCN